MRIVVIGAGRLGAALGRRLAEAGHDVRRGRSSAGWAQITVLAVPQAAVPRPFAGRIYRPGRSSGPAGTP